MEMNKKELVFHGYNNPMLYFNFFDKNYLCVSKLQYQIEPIRTSAHIYIGDNWKGVTFPESEPLAIYSNFYEFQDSLIEKYGSLKGFYKSHPEGVKIFVEPENAPLFLLYYVFQLEKVFNFKEKELELFLKKTNERFWMWDQTKLNLSLGLYSEFKLSLSKEHQKSTFMEIGDLLKLPVECLFLLYKSGRLSEVDFFKKLDILKFSMLSATVQQSARDIKSVAMSVPWLLKSYKNIDIEKTFDVISVLEGDNFLNKFLVEGIDRKNIDWIKSNEGEIKKIMMYVKEGDLDLCDPYEEFVKLFSVCFKPDGKKNLREIISGDEDVSFSQLSYFKEAANKININLIDYLFLQKEGPLKG